MTQPTPCCEMRKALEEIASVGYFSASYASKEDLIARLDEFVDTARSALASECPCRSARGEWFEAIRVATQDGYRHGLEEAAKVCDKMAEPYDVEGMAADVTAHNLAIEIRALVRVEPKKWQEWKSRPECPKHGPMCDFDGYKWLCAHCPNPQPTPAKVP